VGGDLQSSAPTPLSRDARGVRDRGAEAGAGLQANGTPTAAQPQGPLRLGGSPAGGSAGGGVRARETGVQEARRSASDKAAFTIEQDKLIFVAGRKVAEASAPSSYDDVWSKLRRSRALRYARPSL